MMDVLISGEYKNVGERLSDLGYTVHYTKADVRLAKPVQFHADLQVLPFINKHFFTLKDSEIAINGYTAIETLKKPEATYPKDCLCNGLFLGDKLYCNVKAIDLTLAETVKQHGFTVVDLKQGYTKCSTCVVSDDFVITADNSIAKALKNINVLKIEPGNILLPGYNYGFIGGASGKLGDTIYFAGSLKYHPHGEHIKKFIQSANMKYCELLNSPLIDIGGIIKM